MGASTRPSVRIEGSFFIHHSLAHVNRELAKHLSSAGIQVSIAPNEELARADFSVPHTSELKKLAKRMSKNPDLVIRHAFPPNLLASHATHVLMQPWEFFAAPVEWVNAVNSNFVEMWVNSQFTRASYVRSGVDPRKVKCLPLGYDSAVFRPDAEPFPIEGEPGEFRFLYIGGTIGRKGIDVLLRAYTEEFGRGENVRLVVKDSGTKHVYRHNNFGEDIKRLASDPNAPKVTYLCEDLSDTELAGVYRACNCLVAPYRAEGFCLPVLEAMGSGLPVIVTQGGPTDDVVLHGCGWKIGSRPVNIEQMPGLESSLPQAWLEPDPLDLRSAMREALEYRDGLTKERGNTAHQIASSHFDWSQVAPLYAERIRALTDPKSKSTSVSKRPTISLCMIAKNEERVIEACLKSAKPYFDEIVFVDTGSTDKTKEIASKYVDKLLDFPWCDDFSAARNVSVENATGDWIFWMDADDTLPPETGQAIRAATERCSKEATAFVIPVQFVEAGPMGTRVDHIKLFRNHVGIHFEGRIHEQLLPSIRNHEGDVHRLGVVVMHSGYDTSADGQSKKRTRDDRILALELKERPNHPFVLFNMGMTRHFEGRHKEAIKWLNKCLLKAAPDESIVRKAYALLAVSKRELGDIDGALETVLKGLEVVPEDPELRFYAGQLLAVKGRPEEALSHYRQIPGTDIGSFFSSIDMGILSFKTYHNMGGICKQLGRFREAKELYIKAIDVAPEFLPSAFALFDSSLESGDFATAHAVALKMHEFEGPSENWAKMVERHAEAVGGTENALHSLSMCLKTNPNSTGLKLVLARRLLAMQREQDAIPLLRQLASQGVAEAFYCLGVFYVRQGDFKSAECEMQSALHINPEHQQTRDQLQSIRDLLNSEVTKKIVAQQIRKNKFRKNSQKKEHKSS